MKRQELKNVILLLSLQILRDICYSVPSPNIGRGVSPPPVTYGSTPLATRCLSRLPSRKCIRPVPKLKPGPKQETICQIDTYKLMQGTDQIALVDNNAADILYRRDVTRDIHQQQTYTIPRSLQFAAPWLSFADGHCLLLPGCELSVS